MTYEFLCDGPKFYDTRQKRGGGGAIDLVMYVFSLDFQGCCKTTQGCTVRFVLADKNLVVQGRTFEGFPLLIDDDGDAIQPAHPRCCSPEAFHTALQVEQVGVAHLFPTSATLAAGEVVPLPDVRR